MTDKLTGALVGYIQGGVFAVVNGRFVDMGVYEQAPQDMVLIAANDLVHAVPMSLSDEQRRSVDAGVGGGPGATVTVDVDQILATESSPLAALALVEKCSG